MSSLKENFMQQNIEINTTQLGSYQQNLCKTIVRVLPSSSVLKSMVSTFFRWATSLSSFSAVESSKASSIFCSTFAILSSILDTSQDKQYDGLPLVSQKNKVAKVNEMGQKNKGIQITCVEKSAPLIFTPTFEELYQIVV